MKRLWEKVVTFYIYSLFAGPIAMVFLISGDQDYIVNKILTFYFMGALALAIVLWPILAFIGRKKRS
ncbi:MULTISPECIES: hypothetical protein [Acinetobacter]|uniref:hypothetical protein n=1 Tax=Acinetobacter TaxID=469 RepID=UPI00019AE3C1|nr:MULTISPECIES: hypothetical protein [Acinetobacter]EEH67921.1 hypothetical protein HMPREF0023_2496 [Acinetobacter sp. ATCC 27244]NAR56562.1 hypothetical protein [Acinetobacter haemolyticus]NAR91111.1 hypothetical protein [Acinetobacter haemolyticus]QDJ91013.1 hypothetical protein AhaeAN54_002360 [Acinetobacter haemolyticus]